MNGPLDRLRRLISRPEPEVSVSRASLEKYFQCVEEWNEHYFDDEWCDGPRGQACADFIDWFTENHR